ncbi:MAG: hypothetical protein LBK95_15905 [Bifidobacteriaceae bacterium]|jgi:hypothetical protein|nr:hypothetical protein [Bifidobacteriaceae bacterium]
MQTNQPARGRGVRGIGRILMVLGVLVLAAGVVTYVAVGAQLKAEKISVSGDTPFMSSVFGSSDGETPKAVKGPLSAMAQAEAIKAHTAHTPEGFGFEKYNGSTAAEIAHVRQVKDYPGAGTDEADAKMTALWNMMNTSSFLRSALMLSAMAFGVALLVAGVGVVVFLTGLALVKAGHGLDDQRPMIGQVTEVVTPSPSPVVVNAPVEAGTSA